ncbi:ribonuclease R family protein [Buchnera aphidicola]|uniref:ribonuclease R family protein n=1 Tax=Buchnera aphidicola TaxID=9 RepID=UPI0022371281|nr:VacB/RNase II family 3'-5' exoribonuclease [Buchnera aphidicola]MCW5197448.1 VacB/RNase II family 3'-5' exoribonuclease [Buchnera aphidicola (Chaitophorus viminalis)]
MRKYNIPLKWSKNIKNAVNVVKNQNISNEINIRKDLRKLPFITIDEKNSYDFDDAIYCYLIKETLKWKLFVAISDVSFYIKKNSILDREAFNRGNSIYLPLKVIPMLPEELSTNFLSLLPNKDRLCVICEMTLSEFGDLIKYKHYEAVIKSHARITYKNITKIWKKDYLLSKKFKKIKKSLLELNDLNNILLKNEMLKKVISIKNDEPVFIFNSSYMIEKITLKKRTLAHDLVESCMLLANKASALLIHKNNKISLFRNHAYPTYNKVKDFRKILNKFNLRLKGGKKPLLKNYFQLLNKLKNKSFQEIVKLCLLKSTKKAFYSEKNIGHFGLAEKFYTHFTSPIRRYSDLIIHRIIKNILYTKNKNFSKKNIFIKNMYIYNLKNLKDISKKCSITEKRSDKAFKFITNILQLEFAKKNIKKKFYGIISHITEFGFFVKINNLYINGLVHVSTLKDDYYYYNKNTMTLHGKNSKKKFFIGNRVYVQIISIKEKKKIIYLHLI